MFDTLCGLIPVDADYPARTRRLGILRRALDGTLYDALPYEFQDERNPAGEYIPLRSRRPSVRYPLPRIVVDDSLSLLFGDGHFPSLDSDDRGLRAALAEITADSGINQIMLDAALRGSIGSVAIQLRVLRGRCFFRVLDSTYLTPTWDPDEPDRLLRVVERYKVPGQRLMEQGYEVADPFLTYWFQRAWDSDTETWFLPQPIGSGTPPLPDSTRTVEHHLGFVPMVWIRNLPGGDDIDGGCTFRAAIETSIEIDYQLSQAGRGLKYSSDPTLLIREPAGPEGGIIRGGGNALVVSEKGDAKLLEIGGSASAAVIDYVRTLREFALEGVHGNRASPERLSSAQSGRALELMNQGLIWLADNLRVSYGGGLLQLARMIVAASQRIPLRVTGKVLPQLDPTARITLTWPRWHAATAEDRQRDALTLQTLSAAGHISRETAVKAVSSVFSIEDIPAELDRIESERTA